MNTERWIYLLLIPACLTLIAFLVSVVLDQLRRNRRNQENTESSTTPALPSSTDRKIRAAGIHVPGAFFHAFAVLLAALLALLVTELFEGLIIATAMAFFVALYIIYAIVFEIGRMRSFRFEEKLVDAIDIMSSTLRGTENPRQALATAGQVVPAPVGIELQEIVRRLEAGMDIRRALFRMQANFDSEGVRMFCSTLSAKWATGGDLAPTLASLNRLIRERLRHRMRVRSRLVGAQVSAWMVAISPYFILIALLVFSPEWIERLMRHAMGPTLLFFAICCQIIGFLWLRRMMRVEM